MALAIWQRTIVDDTGSIKPGASVEVRDENAGLALAVIYSDRAGTLVKANPFTADASTAFADFFAPGGAYKITVTLGSFSIVWRYVPVGTGAERDIEDLIGAASGVPFLFASETADADPGAGLFRLNNATLSSVTAAYIDNNNSNGNSVTTWLDTFDDTGSSLNRGLLHIFSPSVPGQTFAIYRVTGSVVDGTGYRKLTLEHLSSAGTFLPGETLQIAFTPRGSDGVVGAQYTFDTTTTDSDPGAGKVRLNNATPSSATSVYIDNATAGGATATTWLDSFDDYGNSNGRGTLVIADLTSPATIFHIYRVTGSVVDGTGYRKLTVSYLTGTGSFTNSSLVSVMFVPSGLDGAGIGVPYTFDTTTADADPGSGKLRLNNASPASATLAYIDDNNRDGSDVSAWLNTFDDSGASTLRGQLTILDPAAPGTNFRIYSVTDSVVDGTGYRKVTIAHVAGAGSFTNNQNITIVFNARGPSGGGLADVVDDLTPQLGGDLDTNAFDILFDTAKGIRDDSSNEQLIFVKTASAVNEMTHTNAATGNAPSLLSTGGDSNINQRLGGKGTGYIEVRDPGGNFSPLFGNLPQNSYSAATVLSAVDVNRQILHPTADNNARTFTIDANADLALPIGSFFVFRNQINVLSIAIDTDTLTLGGTATTGTRTLAAGGWAIAMKDGTTSWIIVGVGLS